MKRIGQHPTLAKYLQVINRLLAGQHGVLLMPFQHFQQHLDAGDICQFGSLDFCFCQQFIQNKLFKCSAKILLRIIFPFACHPLVVSKQGFITLLTTGQVQGGFEFH